MSGEAVETDRISFLLITLFIFLLFFSSPSLLSLAFVCEKSPSLVLLQRSEFG